MGKSMFKKIKLTLMYICVYPFYLGYNAYTGIKYDIKNPIEELKYIWELI
jgi:hypothetical protein